MKLGLISAYFLIAVTTASAQTFKVEPSKRMASTKVQPAKALSQEPNKPHLSNVQAPPPAAGPTGIGSLRLGMPKEAVMALSSDEPVRIVGDMTPIVEKEAPPPGTERFEGRIVVPNASDLVKASFTFKDGILHEISMSAKGKTSLLDSLAKQIAERYGPGKVQDNRKDEQCIYRNGNSFTLKSGIVATQWSTLEVNGRVVTTSFTDIDYNFCPSNLRNDLMSANMKVLNFRFTEKEAVAPKNSLF